MPFDASSVRELRKQLSFSQYALARELGCTPQTVQNWEHGRTRPSLDMLDKIHALCLHKGVLEPPLLWRPPSRREAGV